MNNAADTNAITSIVSGLMISDRLVAESAEGDELALQVLTGMVSTIAFYAGKDNDDLMAWDADHARSASAMCAEGDYDEAENHYYEQHVISLVIEARQEIAVMAVAMERYTNREPLTYNPFLELQAAWDIVRAA